MEHRNLLVEIGTEELPSKSLILLAESFAANMRAGLRKIDLAHNEINYYVSPRRLALVIKNLAVAQPQRVVEKRGPALAAAFDKNKQPTAACIGFANACGVAVEQLEIRETEKGAWLFFNQKQLGEATEKLIPNIIREALNKLPIPKPMRWGNHDTEFVRPVHWVVLLFGEKIINAEILGQKTSRDTRGHRFHHPENITLNSASEYLPALAERGKVIADYEQRKKLIVDQIETIANGKGNVLIDEELLNEVNGLVEWPVALLGNFEDEFLQIPAEVLTIAMKQHQKCFSVRDDKDQLLPYFITISNIVSKNPQRVIAGNERVIRARLADAQFFYHTDLQQRLEQQLEHAKTVIFQTKLGSLYDKSKRLAKLTRTMAEILELNVEHAARAGLLAKADLMTNMVGEFPELQGTMGYYYALHDKENKAVAVAIREQYLPRFAGDTLPTSKLGCLLAIADKIDTLVGIFGINQQPSGEKDPFGLRRAALGVLRIIIEKKLPLDLKAIIQIAVSNYGKALNNKEVITQTLDFILERLRTWYLDQAVSTDVFNAVLACYPTQPLDFDNRIHAVQYFQSLPEAEALTAANKRVSNILKKQAIAAAKGTINLKLLTHPAEKNLVAKMEQTTKIFENFFNKYQYSKALAALADLRAPIDKFFDEVMVMVDDKKLRNNRLTLLATLRNLFTKVADISLL